MEQEIETGYHAIVEPEMNDMDIESDETDEIDEGDNSSEEKPLQVHLDKWLWAARFYKTLALARKAIQNGKIYYNGQRSRSSVEISVGGLLRIQHGSLDKLVVVTGLSTRRRSMKDAALLFQDISHHQETLRQVAASYQPTYPRHPYRQRSHVNDFEQSTANPTTKKLVRFLRKPAHRLMPNTYVPTREREVEVEVD